MTNRPLAAASQTADFERRRGSVYSRKRSDAERGRIADTLRSAATEARLTLEELEERPSSVYAARTRSELELLITDVSLRSIADEHMSALTSPTVPPWREGQAAHASSSRSRAAATAAAAAGGSPGAAP